MDARPEGPSGPSPFIRAGGGAAVDPRRLAGVLVWLLVVALLGLAVYLVAAAARQDSRLALLRSRGVPVQVTVTGCRAISSGVGMGVEFWQCRGSFVLSGRMHDEYIAGSRKLLDPGRIVEAVAVPGRPDLLSTASSVRRGNGSTGEYAAAAAAAATGCLLGAGRVVRVRRRGPVRPAAD